MVLHSHMTRRAVLGATLAAASPVRAAEPPRFDTAQHQFTLLRPARIVPPTSLIGLDGRAGDLVAQLGHATLVNFWATWCAACRTELPLLERVHVTMADQGIRVVAISVDQGGRDVVARYVRTLNLRRLPVYVDPEGLVAHSDRDNRRNAPFALYGLPVTYVIDRAKRIVGYLPGAADWTLPAAQELLAYYAGPAG
jgi:thiol-disulfide isomerase/thioredoxin